MRAAAVGVVLGALAAMVTPAAAAPSSSSAPSAPAGPIRQRWEAVRAAGCDVGGVWTPIEARILRNTPFALAGSTFSDAALTAVFAADGGWYRPTLDTHPPLPPPDAACVAKLAAREAELRERWAVPPELETRMTRDHALVEVLRGWGRGAADPYGIVRFLHDPDGAWRVFVTVPGCVPPAECPGFTVRCPVTGPCEPGLAG